MRPGRSAQAWLAASGDDALRANITSVSQCVKPSDSYRPIAAVLVDWNQNTRDHTIRGAYSVRGVPEAVVSTPLRWDEVPDAEPADFTLATVPERFARLGDVHAGIDDAVFSLEPLLEWADRDER